MDSSSASDSSAEERRRRKKAKKEKKAKKLKKEKKRSKRRDSSPSSASEEEQWVEAAGSSKKPEVEIEKPLQTKEKKREEEENEWADFGSSFATFSNDSKRTKRQKEREEMRKLSSIDSAGQTEQELNPYWKDGGKGLPAAQEVDDKPKLVASSVGDGGLAWLKKSFERAKQQAQDEGRSLEEIVAERWGSLETFYSLLQEAEEKVGGSSCSRSKDRDRRDRDRDRDRRHRRDRSDDSEDDSRRKSSRSFKKPTNNSDSEGDDRRSDRDRDRDRRDRDRDRHSRRKDDDGRRREAGRESWRKPDARKESKTLVEERKPSLPADTRSVPLPSREPEKILQEEEPMEEDEQIEETPQPAVLTDKEMNELNAKIFKAEMLGDADTLATLKQKLADAQKTRDEYIKSGKTLGEKSTKVVTKIIVGGGQGQQRRTRDKPTESHKEGQRIRYFPDDDRHSLKSMFEREKMSTVEDGNALFSRLMAKSAKATEDYNVDDIFVDKASSSRQAAKDQKREIENVLNEEKAIKKVLDDCPWCFDGKRLQKNLIVSIGETWFLCVPPFQSLTEGHCLIVPMSHATCTTQLDEDVWSEMQKFKKALIRMFFQSEEDVIFYERAVFLKRQPHMYLECVPLPKEAGELAPIYFKKAIQECETEWAQNKKVVELKDRDVRRAIPKGLPYFSVEFGDDNCGFAHVIEDERAFPPNFAQEIIGGMMELDHQVWRKQKPEDFNKTREKLMKFIKCWAPFDFTKKS